MAISVSLRELLEGHTVASVRLNASLVTELMKEHLLVSVIRGSRKSYRARDVVALRQYLVDKDERYRLMEVDIDGSRASMASATGNSKLVAVRSCPGFMVNSYEPIEALINGASFTINPIEGTLLFISDWQKFNIPEDIIVIGIENMENFRLVSKQKYLFESLHSKILFVSRYPQSTDLREWLKKIPNRYIHFGDFDIAGIHIYEIEYQRHLGERASFFMPDDIKKRLASGSIERYNDQIVKFEHYQPNDSKILELYRLIRYYRRTYDQEGYIKIHQSGEME